MSNHNHLPQILLDSLCYDPSSPSCLRWKTSGTGRRPDLRAGTLGKQGYWQLQSRGVSYAVHRLIWALHHGDPGDLVVDHKDADPSNNRIENLQAISQNENLWRQVGKGWSLTPAGRYVARAAGARGGYIGTFDTPEEAHAAYLATKEE